MSGEHARGLGVAAGAKRAGATVAVSCSSGGLAGSRDGGHASQDGLPAMNSRRPLRYDVGSATGGCELNKLQTLTGMSARVLGVTRIINLLVQWRSQMWPVSKSSH